MSFKIKGMDGFEKNLKQLSKNAQAVLNCTPKVRHKNLTFGVFLL